MQYPEEDLWQWADRVAASAPPWSDERWERANAIVGITPVSRRFPASPSDLSDWSEAA